MCSKFSTMQNYCWLPGPPEIVRRWSIVYSNSQLAKIAGLLSVEIWKGVRGGGQRNVSESIYIYLIVCWWFSPSYQERWLLLHLLQKCIDFITLYQLIKFTASRSRAQLLVWCIFIFSVSSILKSSLRQIRKWTHTKIEHEFSIGNHHPIEKVFK